MPTYKNGDGTKELIIATARRLFLDNGFQNTTLTMISQESGVNRGLIYYHFKDKGELRDLIMNSAFARIAEFAASFTQDLRLRMYLSDLFYWRFYFSNRKFRDFTADIDFDLGVSPSEVSFFLNRYREIYHPDYTPEAFTQKYYLATVSAIGVNTAVLALKGTLLTISDYTEVANSLSRTISGVFDVDKETIETVIAQGMEIDKGVSMQTLSAVILCLPKQ